MVAAGAVGDIHLLLGHHVLSGWAAGEITGGLGEYAATDKFDVTISLPPHTPRFDIDEGVLRKAVGLLSSVVLDLLGP